MHRLTATDSLGIRPYADSSDHHKGLFSLQVVVESPRQASLRNSFHRGPGIHGKQNRRTRKVATDDIPSAPEPAISNGRRFHHLLCGLHYPFLIHRPVRRDRMGALPMYESARCPYFSISPGNLAPDL
jgi:hypothetical protein